MKKLSHDEYYANLPRKITSSGAIFLNTKKEILILKPSYKDHWIFPGGTVEADESPLQACAREVKEEMYLDNIDFKFIGIVFSFANNSSVQKVPEHIQFGFYGGVLSDKEIDKIKLDHDEIIDYKFINLKDTHKYLSPHGIYALPKIIKAIETKQPIYIETK